MPDIAGLKLQRSVKQAEYVRLGEAMAKLMGLRSAVEESTIALRLHDDAASEAMTRWAQSGCVDDMPVGDHQVRTDLLASVARSQAALDSAGAAHSALAEDQRQASAAVVEIAGRIDDAAFDRLAERQAAELITIRALVDRLVLPRIARCMGLYSFFIELAQTHQASGRTDAARAMFQRAAALGPIIVNLDPLPGDIIAKVDVWRRRMADLTGDAL